MPKKEAAVDYGRCRPETCDRGVCVAALECEHGSLVQEMPYEPPETNPARWCRGLAKCASACPPKAITMM